MQKEIRVQLRNALITNSTDAVDLAYLFSKIEQPHIARPDLGDERSPLATLFIHDHSGNKYERYHAIRDSIKRIPKDGMIEVDASGTKKHWLVSFLMDANRASLLMYRDILRMEQAKDGFEQHYFELKTSKAGNRVLEMMEYHPEMAHQKQWFEMQERECGLPWFTLGHPSDPLFLLDLKEKFGWDIDAIHPVNQGFGYSFLNEKGEVVPVEGLSETCPLMHYVLKQDKAMVDVLLDAGVNIQDAHCIWGGKQVGVLDYLADVVGNSNNGVLKGIHAKINAVNNAQIAKSALNDLKKDLNFGL